MNSWIILLFAVMWLVGPIIYSASTIQNLLMGWRIPTTWISSLPSQGWVEVIGKVKGNPIKSLLEKSECAYWQLEVKEYQSSGRGGGRWKTVHRESSGDFEVDDMTGRIKIQDSKMDLVMSDETALENLDPDTKTLVEKLGIKTKGFMGLNKKLRVYERRIVPGEEILVLGKIQKSEGVISVSGASIVPVLISNLSKAELIKTLFWRVFRPLISTYLVGFVIIALYLYLMFK
jgi:hypothetical protein